MFDVRLNGHLSASRNANSEYSQFTFLQLAPYQCHGMFKKRLVLHVVRRVGGKGSISATTAAVSSSVAATITAGIAIVGRASRRH